jgi:hypothetical protein
MQSAKALEVYTEMSGILEYSSTPASNTTLNGIGIAGSNSVKNGDDALRQLMADTATAITKVVDKTGTYTALKADFNQMIRATGTLTLNLTAAATLTAGWCLWVKGDGGAVTVDPNSSEQINGATTLVVANGSSALIICTGTAFRAIVAAGMTEIQAAFGAAPWIPVNNGSAVTVDFDTITTPGWHSRLLTSDASGTHGPPVYTTFYYVQVIETAGGNLIQIAYPYRVTTEKTYVRSRFSGTWTAWKQYAYADEIFPSLISGLTLSNNGSDATNDIDIAAGSASSDDAVPAPLVLASTLTKRLDAAWAVGTNQGGLDTGSIANTTYHIWLIRRPDTGVVDALFSASATSPTMPANYTQKRYLGPIVRASSAIRGFSQSGNIVFWNSKIADRSSTAAFSAALLALSVPTGINVKPIVENIASINVSSTATISIGGAAAGGVEMQMASLGSGASAGFPSASNPPPVFETNTSGQLYYQVVVSGGSFSTNVLNTLGFIFERGR